MRPASTRLIVAGLLLPAVEFGLGYLLGESFKTSGYFFLFVLVVVPWTLCCVGVCLKRKGWLYSLVACLASFLVIFAEIIGFGMIAIMTNGFEGIM